jgi:hypothetical protein
MQSSPIRSIARAAASSATSAKARGAKRGALELAGALGYDFDQSIAWPLLDRELGLLWGLTHGPKDRTASPARSKG